MIPIVVEPHPLESIPGQLKKKQVLLVDSSPKSELRARTMRNLDVTVDCAADVREARSLWGAGRYNLVLINVENELGDRDKFCEDIGGAIPPQQFMFLVGKPEYLAVLPNAVGHHGNGDRALLSDVRAALSGAEVRAPQRWGILEASKQISAARSLYRARDQAKHERLESARDLESRGSRQTEVWSLVLPELQKEELQ